MGTVRDALNSAFDEVMPDNAAEGVTPAAEIPAGTDTGKVEQTSIPAAAPAAETAEQKAGRTAGRPRDDKGRLLPGKAEKKEPQGAVTAAPEAAPPAKARPPRPSSWKKDYWGEWEKIDPALAEYLVQRENEFAKGVSTYKQEWDQVRPIAEAMAQFQPILQQHGIRPEQWITNLGNAHKTLAMGTKEQKLSAFVKLATDYQIPLNEMIVQGQDGKLYINPNLQAQPSAPQQSQAPDIDKVVDQKLMEREVAREIQSFVTATDDAGQPKYPHFEAVKPTMIGLLQAGLATDPKDAYEQALRLPRHSDLAAQIQQQEERAAAEKKAQEQQAAVARARTKAVSPKAQAPSGTSEPKPKGVRGAIESAWDEHVGTGRV